MSQWIHRTRHPEFEKMEERLKKLEEWKNIVPDAQLKRTPEEVLERLKQNYESFSEKMSFTQLSNIPQKPATYLIFKDSNVVYVGSTIHLRKRLKQLLNGRHTLHNKLKELLRTKEDVQEKLKTSYNFMYSLCKDEKEAELLEYFCIEIYSPKFND